MIPFKSFTLFFSVYTLRKHIEATLSKITHMNTFMNPCFKFLKIYFDLFERHRDTSIFHPLVHSLNTTKPRLSHAKCRSLKLLWVAGAESLELASPAASQRACRQEAGVRRRARLHPKNPSSSCRPPQQHLHLYTKPLPQCSHIAKGGKG